MIYHMILYIISVSTVYRPNSSWHTPLFCNQKCLLRKAGPVYRYNLTSYTRDNY